MKTDKPTQFTADDIADWQDYEEVRQGGKWNMFDPRARQATGLSGERYSFVMHNYSALKKAAETPTANTPKI